MPTTDFLKPLIGTDNTLIITCFECCLDVESLSEGNIHKHTCLANILYDEQDSHFPVLEHYISTMGCTKFIIVGHTGCKALKHITTSPENKTQSSYYKRELQKEMLGMHAYFFSKRRQLHLLSEMIVLRQCKAITRFLVGKAHEKKQPLSVQGILIDSMGVPKQLYRNGIQFNDFISSN